MEACENGEELRNDKNNHILNMITSAMTLILVTAGFMRAAICPIKSEDVNVITNSETIPQDISPYNTWIKIVFKSATTILNNNANKLETLTTIVIILNIYAVLQNNHHVSDNVYTPKSKQWTRLQSLIT